MGEAFLWGLVASSSLVIGAAVALAFRLSARTIAWIMAFGVGVLISAVSFDLMEDAIDVAGGLQWPVIGLFAGCAAFFVGDALIDRRGGAHRKDIAGRQEEGSPLSIALGTVLDGIPESMVIGLTIALGGEVGVAYLTAVFISNLPEAMGSTTGLLAAGWARARILGLWVSVALVSAVSSALGYGLLDNAPASTVAFVQGFAAGAILTMLADTMLPQAYAHAARLTGVLVTLGFATALAISALE